MNGATPAAATVTAKARRLVLAGVSGRVASLFAMAASCSVVWEELEGCPERERGAEVFRASSAQCHRCVKLGRAIRGRRARQCSAAAQKTGVAHENAVRN